MKSKNKKNTAIISTRNSFFEFQLDILKIEIDQIKEIVARIDEITQHIKKWTIFIWAGSISLIISISDIEMRRYILFAAVIPFFFWLVDAHFRRRQRQFLYRNRKISEFINSENLEISFKQKKIYDFILFDAKGKQYNSEDVEKYANTIKTMWFKSMRTFYLGIILVTVFMQIVLYPRISDDNTELINFNDYTDSALILNKNAVPYEHPKNQMGSSNNSAEMIMEYEK